jgi:hypothetical protein
MFGGRIVTRAEPFLQGVALSGWNSRIRLGPVQPAEIESLRHKSPFIAHELAVQNAGGIIPIRRHFERLMT